MSHHVPVNVTEAADAVLARLAPPADDDGGGGDLVDRVARLEAPVGPADQTAFHDFHHIEFAFDSVWTEVYDASFVEAVAKLYTTIGRVREFDGYDADDPELATWIGDLDERLDGIDAEAAEAQLVEDPSYGAVVAVFPTMSPALWAWIGPEQRGRFLNFALEYRTRKNPATSPHDEPGLVETVLGDAGGFVDDAIDWVGDAVSDVGDALLGLF